MEAMRPAVVCVGEVDGDHAAMAQLRKWAKRVLKYDARFLVGEEGGCNGLIVFVDKEQGAIGDFKRLGPRVLGVEVAHREAGGLRRAYVALHGLFTSGFGPQLREAEAWADERGGGLVLGDFNHVPCRLWRASKAAMGTLDGQMRRFCGAVCDDGCCGGARPVGAHRQEGARACRVVGGAGDGEAGSVEGEPGWTRFATSEGRLHRPTARYDVAVALGREEGQWRLVEQMPAEHELGAFSDHLLVVVERNTVSAEERERRAVAVARGRDDVARYTC